ncbi:MAG: DNA repair protein RecN [Weeksellaceae bacterium]|jgi:DNA repair protein RecN (Recombination protein N)|nr:DNA repair protein RecN [Weeksellaceae bacterium]
MITRLSVTNFAIIDKLTIEFNHGLTIITGETGAGKSILLGALKLILGERADLKIISNSSKKCVVEAHFSIAELDLQSFFSSNELDYDEETILRRELLPSGKSRAFINDTPVNLRVLQELGNQLIDIHSQFNTADLLNTDFQFRVLDAYAKQIPKVEEYQSLYLIRNQKQSELQRLKNELNQRIKELDYRRFLWEELKSANLSEGEWEALKEEQKELSHIDEIRNTMISVLSHLENPEYGILTQFFDLNSQIGKISDFGKDFNSIQERLQSVKIELEDIQTELNRKSEHLEPQPERLLEINERMLLIQNLLNKHRLQSEIELLDLQTELMQEQSDFEELEQKIEEIQFEINKITAELNVKAQKISESRKKSAPEIEREIIESLKQLGMKDADLLIEFSEQKELTFNGSDKVQYLFSANKGFPLKPLEQTISGGERSRIMLAIKRNLAGKLNLPTLILDEIDTGVSGKVANEVGNMMKEMAHHLQLISITHLPQVASKADTHLKVRKKTREEETSTEVILLSKEARIQEIAELISGSDITDSARKQAEELLRN